jgi:hypothetical protein
LPTTTEEDRPFEPHSAVLNHAVPFNGILSPVQRTPLSVSSPQSRIVVFFSARGIKRYSLGQENEFKRSDTCRNQPEAGGSNPDGHLGNG